MRENVLRILAATALIAATAAIPTTAAADQSPYTAFYAVGRSANYADFYATTPTWQFTQPLNSPVDLSVVNVNIANGQPGHSWYLTLAGPAGTPLTEGTFSFSSEAPFRPSGEAGFQLLSAASSCSYPHGTFTISEITRDSSGVATTLSAAFDVTCTQHPTASTSTHGELNINSNRTWPAWTVSPPTLGMPDVLVGSTATREVTVTNNGLDGATVQAEFLGNFPSDYSVDDPDGCLGQALAGGSSCTFGVVFTPAVRGDRNAIMWLSDDGFATVWMVTLWGTSLDVTSTTLTVPATGLYPNALLVKSHVTGGDGNKQVEFTSNDELFGVESLYQYEADRALYMPPGDFTLSAQYQGDSVSAPSVSTQQQVHIGLNTVTTLTGYPGLPAVGDTVRLFARVVPPGSYMLSGGTLSIVDTVTGLQLVSVPASGPLAEARVDCRVTSSTWRQYQARYSGDGQFAASTAIFTSPTCLVDSTPPTGSLTADGGTAITNNPVLALAIAATDPSPSSGLTDMQLTQDPNAWPDTWQPYSTTGTLTLTGQDGVRHVYVRFRDGSGNVSNPATAAITLDRAAPAAIAPYENIVLNSSAGSTISLAVGFATTDATSGVATYELAQSNNGCSTFQTVVVPAGSTSVTRSLKPGSIAHCFRTRATDAAGNTSGWTSGPTFIVQRAQENIVGVTYSGSWSNVHSSSASGSAFRQTASAGAAMNYTFIGHDLALFGKRSTKGGLADVYVDGIKVSSGLDFYGTATAWKRVLFQMHFASGGEHTVRVVALGTKDAASKGKLINLDGFLVVS